MKRYLDFESDIEKIENKINKLDITDGNFNNQKEELLKKKKYFT